MNRGYFKFWRKAGDSRSWNRGLLYQGLMINLLMRTAWKKSSYKGKDLLPGQFGAVFGQLADSLGIPKTTLHRMVFHLAEDGFLTVENMGNRFSIITIVNWHSYQDCSGDSWNAGGTPVEHQRNAGGTPSYKEEEVKNIYITPHTPLAGGSDADTGSEPANQSGGLPAGTADKPKAKRQRRPVVEKAPREFSAWFEKCWSVYPHKTSKRQAWQTFFALEKAGELPADLVERIENRCLESDWRQNIQDPERKRFLPHMSTWLNDGGWDDEGCLGLELPATSEADELRARIEAKYNFGMPLEGESPESVWAKSDLLAKELAEAGL